MWRDAQIKLYRQYGGTVPYALAPAYPITYFAYPMKQLIQLGGILTISLSLAACGGGGGDSPAANSGAGTSPNNQASTGNAVVTDARVIADLKSSNIDFGPGANSRPAGTWRWSDAQAKSIQVYIPAPAAGNSTEQDYAAKVRTSIALINTKLAGLVALEAVGTVPASGNYIQISYSTSWVPPGSTDYSSYCANVATGPSTGSMIMPDSKNGIFSVPVYINLGNGHCNVTQDIVTHEFGHALGLANHYNGFGIGIDNVTEFWDVLATLYGNPQSTTQTALVVKRAAK